MRLLYCPFNVLQGAHVGPLGTVPLPEGYPLWATLGHSSVPEAPPWSLSSIRWGPPKANPSVHPWDKLQAAPGATLGPALGHPRPSKRKEEHSGKFECCFCGNSGLGPARRVIRPVERVVQESAIEFPFGRIFWAFGSKRRPQRRAHKEGQSTPSPSTLRVSKRSPEPNITQPTHPAQP